MTTTTTSAMKNAIRRAVRHAKVQGLTVGEIFDNMQNAYYRGETSVCPGYNSVRARVYEMATKGELVNTGTRKDRCTGKVAQTFRRPQ